MTFREKFTFFEFWAQQILEALINNRLENICVKSIFTLILKVSDKFIEKCRSSWVFGE